MKKPKTLETKLRSAIRLIWSRSAERRAVIKLYTDPEDKNFFLCPLCPAKACRWPIQLATVDHDPPIGTLDLENLTDFVKKMFYGHQRVLCSPCHKKVTAEQRRKKC
jgi:hypothetical protein